MSEKRLIDFETLGRVVNIFKLAPETNLNDVFDELPKPTLPDVVGTRTLSRPVPTAGIFIAESQSDALTSSKLYKSHSTNNLLPAYPSQAISALISKGVPQIK